MDQLKSSWNKDNKAITTFTSPNDGKNGDSLSKNLAIGGDILSTLQNFGAAQVRIRSLKAQAETEKYGAVAEIGNYNLQSFEAGQRYLDAVATTNSAVGASGVDVGSGSVKAIKSNMADELNRYTATIRENAVAAALARKSRMMSLKSEAAQAKNAAWLNAFSSMASTASKASQTG